MTGVVVGAAEGRRPGTGSDDLSSSSIELQLMLCLSDESGNVGLTKKSNRRTDFKSQLSNKRKKHDG